MFYLPVDYETTLLYAGRARRRADLAFGMFGFGDDRGDIDQIAVAETASDLRFSAALEEMRRAVATLPSEFPEYRRQP